MENMTMDQEAKELLIRHDEQIKNLISTMSDGMGRLEVALTQHVQEDRELAKDFMSIKVNSLAQKRTWAMLSVLVAGVVGVVETVHHLVFIAPALAEIAKLTAGR